MAELLIKLGDAIQNKYIFDKDMVTIGRAKDNDIILENLSVSRNHVRIKHENEEYFIVDLNSANGTYVNGIKITKTALSDNDVVAVGKYRLIFVNKGLDDQQKIFDLSAEEKTMVIQGTAPNAKLTVLKGKELSKKFSLEKDEVTLGKGKDCAIVINDMFIGKHHATIKKKGNRYYLYDTGSWRGTQVNGETISEIPLMDGDLIKIGSWELEFSFTKEDQVGGITGRIPEEMAQAANGAEISEDDSGVYILEESQVKMPVFNEEESFLPSSDSSEDDTPDFAPAEADDSEGFSALDLDNLSDDDLDDEDEDEEKEENEESYLNVPNFMQTEELDLGEPESFLDSTNESENDEDVIQIDQSENDIPEFSEEESNEVEPQINYSDTKNQEYDTDSVQVQPLEEDANESEEESEEDDNEDEEYVPDLSEAFMGETQEKPAYTDEPENKDDSLDSQESDHTQESEEDNQEEIVAEETEVSYLKQIGQQVDLEDPEVMKWYQGLRTHKTILRNYAAKQLRKLTGIEIDTERL